MRPLCDWAWKVYASTTAWHCLISARRSSNHLRVAVGVYALVSTYLKEILYMTVSRGMARAAFWQYDT